MINKWLLIFVIIAVITLAILLALSFHNAIGTSNELAKPLIGNLIF